MNVEIETKSYNEKRYGKPYIGIINFSNSSEGEISWGKFIGTEGYEGLLSIEAESGDVLIRGQKDNRGSNSSPRYYRLNSDGELIDIGYNKLDAYKASKDKVSMGVDALIVEREKLLLRIAKIDELISND